MPQELRKRHKSHARALKHLEERFEWYADCIEMEPAPWRGRWLQRGEGDFRELRLDLGCGKGAFALAEAQANPDVLFVGLDYDKICIARAAQLAHEAGVSNLVFTLADAEDIRELFGPGELARVHLNFSTPHPRKKHARERLTYVDELVKYREVLGADGEIRFKTDSPMFFDFSIAQFEMAAYDFTFTSRDLHADMPDLPQSEYEQRLTAKGAKICALHAVKADRPITLEQKVPLSLFDYLPEDLDAMEYVPYGMEGGVLNFRNRRAKEAARAGSQLDS